MLYMSSTRNNVLTSYQLQNNHLKCSTKLENFIPSEIQQKGLPDTEPQAFTWQDKQGYLFQHTDGIDIKLYDAGLEQWQSIARFTNFINENLFEKPEYYLTVHTLIANSELYLVGRKSDGIWVSKYNEQKNQWGNVLVNSQRFIDSRSWNKQQYYKSLKVIKKNNHIYFLGRGRAKAFLHSYDFANNKWTHLSDFHEFRDDQGWDSPQYYETLKLISNDNTLLLLGRGGAYIHLSEYLIDSNTWRWLPELREFKDVDGWDSPELYNSLHVVAIDKKLYLAGYDNKNIVLAAFDFKTNAWDKDIINYPYANDLANSLKFSVQLHNDNLVFSLEKSAQMVFSMQYLPKNQQWKTLTIDNTPSIIHDNGELEKLIASGNIGKIMSLVESGDVGVDTRLSNRLTMLENAATHRQQGITDYLSSIKRQNHYQSLNNGLVAYYPFDGDVDDKISNYLSTKTTNIIFTEDRFDTPNKSCQLDGQDSQVQVTTKLSYQTFSLSMWLKPATTQKTYADIIDNNHDGYRSWVIQYDQSPGNPNKDYYAFFGLEPHKQQFIHFGLKPNEWQHLVIMKTPEKLAEVYINGKPASKSKFDLNDKGSIKYDGTEKLTIGNWSPENSNRNWNGSIDDLRIYNRALSTHEVATLYHVKPNIITTTSLLKAVKENNIDRVKLLLKQGVFVDGFDRAMSNEAILLKVIKQWLACNPLHEANQKVKELVEGNKSDFFSELLFSLGTITFKKNEPTELVALCFRAGVDVNQPLTKYKPGPEYIDIPLIQAAWHGHISIVKLLLEYGADWRMQDHNSMTALKWAEHKDYRTIMEVLKQHSLSAQPIKKGLSLTSLHWSIILGYNEITNLLIQSGANINLIAGYDKNTALHLAVIYSNDDIIKTHLHYGADASIKNLAGKTAGDLAVEYNKTTIKNIIEKHISKQIPVNKQLLEAASVNNSQEVIRLCEQEDVSLNTRGSLVHPAQMDARDWTPSHWAAYYGNVELLHFLIEKGANINVRAYNGDSILNVAVFAGRLDVAKEILNAGFNINNYNQNLHNAMHAAIDGVYHEKLNDSSAIDYLFRNGINVLTRDNQNRTVFDRVDDWINIVTKENNEHQLKLYTQIQELFEPAKNLFEAIENNDIQAVLILAPHAPTYLREQAYELALMQHNNELGEIIMFKSVRPEMAKLLEVVINKESKSIVLSSLGILNGEEVNYLAKALEINNDIDVLMLSGCGIDATAMEILAPEIAKCEKLKIGILDNNPMGNSGVKLLAEALDGKQITSLNLFNCDITHEGMQYLNPVIKNTLVLEQLNLGDNEVDVAILKDTQSLVGLHLHNANINKEAMTALMEIVKKNPSIKEINLSHSRVGDEHARLLAEAFFDKEKPTELHLFGCGITEVGINYLASLIRNNTELTALNLGNNKADKIDINILTGTQSLVLLHLQYANIDTQSIRVFKTIIESNTDIKNINLDNNLIGDTGVKLLMQAINHQSIEALHLANCHIGNDGVNYLRPLLQNNKKLRHLNLASNEFTLEAKLLEGTNSLVDLNLHNTNINAITMKALHSILKNNFNLVWLNLSNNLIGDEGTKLLGDAFVDRRVNGLHCFACGITNVGIKYLKPIISNPALRYLDLGGNKFDINLLTETQSLVGLHLHDVNIKAENMATLKQILTNNPRLSELNLNNNEIGNGDKGVHLLAEGLEKTNITRLHLAGNQLNDNNVQAIISIINRHAVEFLNLGQNQFSQESILQIVDALKDKHFLKAIHFENSGLDFKTIEKLYDIINPDMLYLGDIDGNPGIEHICALPLLQAIKAGELTNVKTLYEATPEHLQRLGNLGYSLLDIAKKNQHKDLETWLHEKVAPKCPDCHFQTKNIEENHTMKLNYLTTGAVFHQGNRLEAPSGNYYASLSEQGIFAIFDAKTDKQIWATENKHQRDGKYSLTFGPQGLLILRLREKSEQTELIKERTSVCEDLKVMCNDKTDTLHLSKASKPTCDEIAMTGCNVPSQADECILVWYLTFKNMPDSHFFLELNDNGELTIHHGYPELSNLIKSRIWISKPDNQKAQQTYQGNVSAEKIQIEAIELKNEYGKNPIIQNRQSYLKDLKHHQNSSYRADGFPNQAFSGELAINGSNGKQAIKGWRLIHLAAWHADSEGVKWLLEHGAHLEPAADGWTPLHAVAASPYVLQEELVAITSLLVKHGVDINAKTYDDSKTALHMTVIREHDAITKYLVNQGADFRVADSTNKLVAEYAKLALALWLYEQEMQLAVYEDDDKRFSQLIRLGVRPELEDAQGHSLWLRAAILNSKKILHALSSLNKQTAYYTSVDHEGNSALHLAAYHGNVESIDQLFKKLESGTTNKQNQQTFLHAAIIANQLEFIKSISRSGRNYIHFLMNKSCDKQLPSGETVSLNSIELAVALGHEDILDRLIVSYETINGGIQQTMQFKTHNKLGSLLHLALYFNQLEMISHLLTKHKNRFPLVVGFPIIEIADNNDMTLLNLAAKLGNVDAVHTLNRHGANLNAKDEQGLTPAHWAVKEDHPDVLCQLGLLGANLKISSYGRGLKHPLGLAIELNRENMKHFLRNWNKHPFNCAIDNKYKTHNYENLVFQGGGPRGIAYVGALRNFIKNGYSLNDIQRVAGTSAGAITALLVALDYSVGEIEHLLHQTNLTDFLEGELTNLPKMDSVEGFLQSAFKPATLLYLLQTPITLAKFAFNAGVSSGENFRGWIENTVIKEKLGDNYKPNMTFGDLAELVEKSKSGKINQHYKHLYVIGTHINTASETGREKIFSSTNKLMRDIVISDAIRISMSIPGVFYPHQVYTRNQYGERVLDSSERYYVDGGVVNNYPIKLFDGPEFQQNSPYSHQSPRPFNKRTLGFSLFSVGEIQSLNQAFDSSHSNNLSGMSILTYSWGTIYNNELTHFDDADKTRTVFIDNRNVGLTEFNLPNHKKQSLIQAGSEAVESFCYKYWETCQDEPIRPIPQPQPQRMLTRLQATAITAGFSSVIFGMNFHQVVYGGNTMGRTLRNTLSVTAPIAAVTYILTQIPYAAGQMISIEGLNLDSQFLMPNMPVSTIHFQDNTFKITAMDLKDIGKTSDINFNLYPLNFTKEESSALIPKIPKALPHNTHPQLEYGETLHCQQKQLNSSTQQFIYTFTRELIVNDNNALCQPQNCQPKPICHIKITLTSREGQQAASSPYHQGIYHLAENGGQVIADSTCQPQHIELAINATNAQLPNYEWQQWQYTAESLLIDNSITGTKSAGMTACSLLAEDVALAYGYTATQANWFGKSMYHTLQGSQLAYDIYQGADAMTALLPLLASNAVYYALDYSGKVDKATVTSASTTTYYAVKTANGGYLQAACGFFASTIGSTAGSWLARKVSDTYLSSKLEPYFQKRLENFNEKTNTLFQSLKLIKQHGGEKLAKTIRHKIEPMLTGVYNTIANQASPSFAVYRQLSQVEQTIDAYQEKLLNIQLQTMNPDSATTTSLRR